MSYVEKILVQKSAFDHGFRDEVEQEITGTYFFKNPITDDFLYLCKNEGHFVFSVVMKVADKTFQQTVSSTEELWLFVRDNLKSVRG